LAHQYLARGDNDEADSNCRGDAPSFGHGADDFLSGLGEGGGPFERLMTGRGGGPIDARRGSGGWSGAVVWSADSWDAGCE
jgi:hypothetical protein